MTEATRHGLLDTSVVVMLARLRDPDTLPEKPVISSITLAELTLGPIVASDDLERARRQRHLQQAEADFEPIPFDVAAARAFGHVAADLRRSGRKPAARTFDALIAAVAVANGLPLYTANARDFSGVSNLTVVPVPQPTEPLD